MSLYRSAVPNYQPEPGFHGPLDAPAWCENHDPHVPGLCTAAVGDLGDLCDLEQPSLSVLVTSGRPVLTVYHPDAPRDLEFTGTANLRQLAEWLLTALAMADEAAGYLTA